MQTSGRKGAKCLTSNYQTVIITPPNYTKQCPLHERTPKNERENAIHQIRIYWGTCFPRECQNLYEWSQAWNGIEIIE